MNASESARAILQTAYVEKKTINALQLYNMLGELTRIKGAARNMGIYSLMLAFQGDNRAYLPGTVISFGGNCRMPETVPWFGVSTAARLLGVSRNTISLAERRKIQASQALIRAAVRKAGADEQWLRSGEKTSRAEEIISWLQAHPEDREKIRDYLLRGE